MSTVLIIDDQLSATDALGAMLQSMGCDTIVAHDGDQGLRYIRSRPLDLVVLDHHMTGLSGMDVLRSLRSTDQDVNTPPVVMWSADGDGRAEAMRWGARGFFVKTDWDSLLAAVERHTDCR